MKAKSKKAGGNRKAGYIPWDEFVHLMHWLKYHKNNKWLMYFASSAFCGLRVSDASNLKWESFVDEQGKALDYLNIKQKKRGKFRKIKINADFKAIILYCYHKTDPDLSDYILPNKFKGVMSHQGITKGLKQIIHISGIKIIGNLSTHMLRKTLGRRVAEEGGWKPEVLERLRIFYGHSDIKTTLIYLGVQDEEVDALTEYLDIGFVEL